MTGACGENLARSAPANDRVGTQFRCLDALDRFLASFVQGLDFRLARSGEGRETIAIIVGAIRHAPDMVMSDDGRRTPGAVRAL